MIFRIVFFFTLLLLLPPMILAESATSCFYTDSRGVIKVADELLKVPSEYRESAQCRVSRADSPARPNEVSLSGNVRSVSMASPVGRIELRWPRALEKLFGRTPERALADAAKTASRALKGGGFPGHMATVDLSWRIIFLDQNLPEKGIPMQLVSQCHPGWMYPPADIFIVGQRIVSGCSSAAPLDARNADRALARVLLHEMGHALEFALLHGKGQGDHFRAEGFASWFEDYAAQYSSLIDRSAVSTDYGYLGLTALNSGMSGASFSGSPLDYGLSFLYMRHFVDKRGVSGLMRLYEKRLAHGEPFVEALQKELALNPAKIRLHLGELAGALTLPH